MRDVKEFNEFIRSKIVRKQTPDKSRAKFLVQEAERDYSIFLELLEKIGVRDNNANFFVKTCYDIIMEQIRAKMLLDGYNATGKGAHEAEVSYLKILGFRENDIQFANQLRFFRNGMLYYGTALDKEYANKVLDFLKRVYPKLKKLNE